MQLQLRASIGAVLSSNRFETAADYVRAADIALYDA